MSGKAFYFIIVLLLFALFASVNLNNSVTISIGFRTFENVPVFLFALFSFLIGFLVTAPFFISGSKKHYEKRTAEKKDYDSATSTGASAMNNIQEVELKGEKKSWFQKLKENKKNDENKTCV